MAKIILNDKEIEVKDGDYIKEGCKKAGIKFGCEAGLCGVCKIEIIEGNENLDEPHYAEEIMGLKKNKRLACQCRIKKETVKIKTEY